MGIDNPVLKPFNKMHQKLQQNQKIVDDDKRLHNHDPPKCEYCHRYDLSFLFYFVIYKQINK